MDYLLELLALGSLLFITLVSGLIRMLLINSCMMCWKSMNESEEIVHDLVFQSQYFFLDLPGLALAPRFCLCISFPQSCSPSYPTHSLLPPLLSPPSLCPQATETDCGVWRLNEAVLIH